jgi:hypothetical protein
LLQEAFLKKRFLYLFLEMPHLSREMPVAEHLAWHDSLANYGSSTTFRHLLLSLSRFSPHIKTLKREKILLCTTGIASQKRQIMVLVTLFVTHGINWPLWPSIEISPDSLDGFLRSKLPLGDGS